MVGERREGKISAGRPWKIFVDEKRAVVRKELL
jgi:hypothetical protein